MYNRYIPQSDGSYRKRPVAEPGKPPPPPVQSPPPCRERPTSPAPPQRADSFLRGLLPGDFDTEDLLVVLLLLLMTGRGGQEKNTSLLTLALYLIL